MRRLPALVAALLLPVAPPLLLGQAVSTGAVLLAQTPAQAQTAGTVAKVAEAITVRVKGTHLTLEKTKEVECQVLEAPPGLVPF